MRAGGSVAKTPLPDDPGYSWGPRVWKHLPTSVATARRLAHCAVDSVIAARRQWRLCRRSPPRRSRPRCGRRWCVGDAPSSTRLRCCARRTERRKSPLPTVARRPGARAADRGRRRGHRRAARLRVRRPGCGGALRSCPRLPVRRRSPHPGSGPPVAVRGAGPRRPDRRGSAPVRISGRCPRRARGWRCTAARRSSKTRRRRPAGV